MSRETTMPGSRPILRLAVIGAILAAAVCCALFAGDALVEGAKTAIAVSR